jgi:hypothetical protein
VELGGFGELHAPFLTERRARGSLQCSVTGNPGPGLASVAITGVQLIHRKRILGAPFKPSFGLSGVVAASIEAAIPLIRDRAKPKPAPRFDACRWGGQGAVLVHEGPEVFPDVGLGGVVLQGNIMATKSLGTNRRRWNNFPPVPQAKARVAHQEKVRPRQRRC